MYHSLSVVMMKSEIYGLRTDIHFMIIVNAWAIRWYYLMRANKKEKYDRALIGVFGKLCLIFNRMILFVFWGYQEQFLDLSRTIFGFSKNDFLYQLKILKIVLA